MPERTDAERAGTSAASLPRSGTVLITGPSNVGKTRLTARALERWVRENGASGVVVLDFAPELHRDGRLLGGRLGRFTEVPDDAWTGVIDAHAPRAESDDERVAVERARENADNAATLFSAAPSDPRAVFVNDATIPFQHESGSVDALLTYCDRASVAVLNAFESDELGDEDRVSRQERATLRALRARADRVVELD